MMVHADSGLECVYVCTDDWEIPFENISDLQWLGSGAQGAVFLGKLRGELVAIKKLSEKRETDIKHLRKLNHPNIISFKYVCCGWHGRGCSL